jgi:N4-gp56 family major capsid protein
MPSTEYGDISPNTAGYICPDLLEHATPFLVSEQFADGKTLGKNQTDTINFGRYNPLDYTPNYLVEGVTPAGKKPNRDTISVPLREMGDWLGLTNKVADMHTDPVLQEMVTLCGEQSGAMLETARLNTIKGGTSVFYSNGVARASVNTKISRDHVRRVVRFLARQHARRITKRVASTASFSTQSVEPAYVCLCHTDCAGDVRDMAGFISVKDYGGGFVYPTEIGAVDEVRFVSVPLLFPWADAGGDAGTTMISTGGTKADVYPFLFFGQHAFATVAFKGQNAVTPKVLNPGPPREGDPLGQRGSVGWRTYVANVILNDSWLARLEAAVKL